MATQKIRNATLADAAVLAPDLPASHTDLTGAVYTLSLHASSSLSPRLRTRIWTLFDGNMSAVSQETSMTYTQSTKNEEFFDPSGKFILLQRERRSMPGSMPRIGAGGGKGKGRAAAAVDFDPEDLVGYCSFRFDTEETLGSKDAEVIYCYELQLDPAVRRAGLGAVLIGYLERIGRERKMDKSMLTCLKGNLSAIAFYRKQGYTSDEIDPTRMAEEESDSDSEDGWEDVGEDGVAEKSKDECDYVILSKVLR